MTVHMASKQVSLRTKNMRSEGAPDTKKQIQIFLLADHHAYIIRIRIEGNPSSGSYLSIRINKLYR